MLFSGVFRFGRLFFGAVFVLVFVLSSVVFGGLEDSLVAYYPFDGDAADHSGNGNDGIIHNVDLVEGISGQAYSFRGVGNWGGTAHSSYIEIDGSGSYNTYTVSMWARIGPNLIGQGIMFSDAHGAGAQSHGRPDIGIREGKYFIIGGGSGSGKATSLLTGYNDDQWDHVVGTVNATTNTVQLYVNGEFQRAVSTKPAYPLILNNSGSANRVDIGARSWKNVYFKGVIDEVSIYDKVLSAEEVLEVFESMSDPYPVIVDIKPGSVPNPVNVRSRGVLSVAILGSEEFDVSSIVATSVRLGGVEAVRDSYEDVAGIVAEPEDCSYQASDPDGYQDLVLKFKIQDIVQSFGEVDSGDVLSLDLSGVLEDETPIEGHDCVVIVGKHIPINKADVNNDGLVNVTDLAIIGQSWLQSSIVEEEE